MITFMLTQQRKYKGEVYREQEYNAQGRGCASAEGGPQSGGDDAGTSG